MILLKSLSLLSLLIYSINHMSKEIEGLTQNRILLLLKKATTNIFTSFILGIMICLITQSSSVVTVLVITLISAQHLSLEKGLGIVIGSNIGTTLISLLLAFDISYIYYAFILIGVLYSLLSKKTNHNILLWLGIIFLCLDLIEQTLINGFDNHFLQSLMLKNNSALTGTIAGTIISFLIQSSSATILLTQKLYENNLITPLLGVSIMLGANIGTTINGLLFSLNSSVDSKRLALGSLLFNIFGVLMVFPLLYIKNTWHNWDTPYLISISHIYFNIITGFLGLFLIKPLSYLTKKIIP